MAIGGFIVSYARGLDSHHIFIFKANVGSMDVPDRAAELTGRTGKTHNPECAVF